MLCGLLACEDIRAVARWCHTQLDLQVGGCRGLARLSHPHWAYDLLHCSLLTKSSYSLVTVVHSGEVWCGVVHYGVVHYSVVWCNGVTRNVMNVS